MRTDIIDYLIALAKKGETVKLQQLCNDCKLKLDMEKEEDKAYILNILDEITLVDQKMGRPLLASLVFDYNKGVPENNYFITAEKLGLFSLDLKSERKLEFHIGQLERVFKFWDSPKSDVIKKSKFNPLMNDFLSAFKSRYNRQISKPYYLSDL
jgi:hypothetical protein